MAKRTNRDFLILINLLVLVTSLVFFFTSIHLRNEAKARYNLAPNTQIPFTIGKSIRMGQVVISVSQVNREAGKNHFKLPSGYEYVVINMNIKNIYDKPIHVLPSSDTYLKDTFGNVVYLTPYNLHSPLRGGELPAGETIKGELSFAVKKNTTYHLFVDSAWSGGVLKFNL